MAGLFLLLGRLKAAIINPLMEKNMKIGVISDTHGYIHPGAFEHLEGTDLILHAGDIGNENILSDLEALAPVTAVTGNTDSFPLTGRLNEREIIDAGGVRIYLTHRFIEGSHIIHSVMKDIQKESPDIVVFGHTHQQYADNSEGILFFNPGAAGHRRPGTRTGVGLLELGGARVDHKIFYLE